MSRDYPGMSTPVLLGGKLYVATLTSIISMDPATGWVTRSETVRQSSTWDSHKSAGLVVVPGTTRLIHRAEGYISVYSTATYRSSHAYVSGGENISWEWELITDAKANVWWTQCDNHLAQLGFDNAGTRTPRALGLGPYTAPTTSRFIDVSPTQEHYKAMAWLADAKISTGWDAPDANGWYSPNGPRTYRPLTTVKRDAMAAFLYRMAGSPRYVAPAVSPFRDVSPGQEHYAAMAWLAEAKISTGWVAADGTSAYRPLAPVNRDAMAAFLYRLAGSPQFEAPAVSPFKDVRPGQEHYKAMAWLASRGISTGWVAADGTRTYRPLAPVNRDAMAAFLYRLSATTL